MSDCDDAENCEACNPPPAKDYDRSIHSNPSAQAWAKFFMETWAEHKNDPDWIDESTMLGWFANAMMAQHDHLFQTDAFKKDVQEAVERERSECVKVARRYVDQCLGERLGERITANVQRSEQLASQAVGASHVGDEIEKRNWKGGLL